MAKVNKLDVKFNAKKMPVANKGAAKYDPKDKGGMKDPKRPMAKEPGFKAKLGGKGIG